MLMSILILYTYNLCIYLATICMTCIHFMRKWETMQLLIEQ